MSLLLGFVALAAPTASAASTAEALAGKIREFPIPTAQSAPGEIATGSDGTLWFTELFGNQGENGSPPIDQAIHFSEKLAPDKDYLVRVALRLMGVAASALETGQFSLASFASFWKVSSSMPGTTASVSRSIGLMAKPPGT